MRMVAADRRNPRMAAGTRNCCRFFHGDSQKLT